MGQSCSHRHRAEATQQPIQQPPRVQQRVQQQHLPQVPQRHFFLGVEWQTVLTTAQKWRVVIKRITALLNARKRNAYYMQILAQLTKLGQSGRPSTQVLFKELSRQNGELKRKEFKRWIPADPENPRHGPGQWVESPAVGTWAAAELGIWQAPPWTPEFGASAKPKPYGRTLVNDSGLPPQTTIPRLEAKSKPKPKARPRV